MMIVKQPMKARYRDMYIKRSTHNSSTLSVARNMGMQNNVTIRVLDAQSGKVVQEHSSHNTVTNTMLLGIAHYLIGDGVLNQGTYTLSNYIPRYISLGTMGLLNQEQDSQGYPAGIGTDIAAQSTDPTYISLKQALEAAEAEVERTKAVCDEIAEQCPNVLNCTLCQDESCSCKQQAIAAKNAYEAALAVYETCYNALYDYQIESQYQSYVDHRPGFGADGYDPNANNDRKWTGLGYAYTSYSNANKYYSGDIATYNGTVYRCINTTPQPAGPFNPERWSSEGIVQPMITDPSGRRDTINIELVSQSFPRSDISFRDIVPEYQSELPHTVDAVFSAMISTGALAQFRGDRDYIFITEAGLWSQRMWSDTGENGLLAGYRLMPSNSWNLGMIASRVTDYDLSKHFPDLDISSLTEEEKQAKREEAAATNRNLLKKSILRVAKNQVVQVIWKIQMGSIDQLQQIASGGSTGDLPEWINL